MTATHLITDHRGTAAFSGSPGSGSDSRHGVLPAGAPDAGADRQSQLLPVADPLGSMMLTTATTLLIAVRSSTPID